MATASRNIGSTPIIPIGSQQQPLSPIIQQTSQVPVSTAAVAISGLTVSNAAGLRESQAPNPGDLSGIFSVVLNRQHQQNHQPLSHHHVRWPSFSMGNRSFWTKYCLLCTVCGSAATILAGIFLVVAALFRYYTTSIYYFETVPTYIPAILVSFISCWGTFWSCNRSKIEDGSRVNKNFWKLRHLVTFFKCSSLSYQDVSYASEVQVIFIK